MFASTCALMCEMRVQSAPKDLQQNDQLIGFSVTYNTQHSKTDAGFLSLKNTGLKKIKVRYYTLFEPILRDEKTWLRAAATACGCHSWRAFLKHERADDSKPWRWAMHDQACGWGQGWSSLRMSSNQQTGMGIFHEDGRDWTRGVDPLIVGKWRLPTGRNYR